MSLNLNYFQVAKRLSLSGHHTSIDSLCIPKNGMSPGSIHFQISIDCNMTAACDPTMFRNAVTSDKVASKAGGLIKFERAVNISVKKRPKREENGIYGIFDNGAGTKSGGGKSDIF